MGKPEHPALRSLWYAGLLLALVLRVVLIDRHGLWNNELITVGVLNLPYGQIVSERLAVNHMPLYFLMEKAVSEAFGNSESALRAIGAFFGWMAVWAAGRLGRRLGGLRLGVPVVFAGAIHQYWLATSLEARMYSIVMWAAAESTDAYFAWARAEAAEDRRKGNLALLRWVATSVFAIHIHMLHGVIFIFQLGDVLVRKLRDRLPIRRFMLAIGLALLLCIPISIAWAMNQNKIGDESEPDFKNPGILHRQTIRMLWGEYDTLEDPVTRIAAYLLLIVGLGSLIAYFRRARRDPRLTGLPDPATRRDLAALGIGYLVFLAGVYLAATISSSSMLGELRYYVGFGPGLLILALAGLLYLHQTRPRLALPCLAAAFLLQATFSGAYYRGVGEGFREAVEAIESDLPPGRGVICVLSGGAEKTIGKYYGQSFPRRILKLDRYEKNRHRVRKQVDNYSEEFSEFWLLTYHEKREKPIWKVLMHRSHGYRPRSLAREIGDSKIQLFERVTVSETTGQEPDIAGPEAPGPSGEAPR